MDYVRNAILRNALGAVWFRGCATRFRARLLPARPQGSVGSLDAQKRYPLWIGPAGAYARAHSAEESVYSMSEGHSGQVSPIESSTWRSSATASSGDKLVGGSCLARSKACSRACGSARSFAQPCSSHSWMAPASCSTASAQPRSVRVAGRRSFVSIGSGLSVKRILPTVWGKRTS